jgi:predicted restriction endonuclease
VTGERTLPVLDAAHIKPYDQGGPHDPRNGLLLRTDLHRLLDSGHATVTPDLRFWVSERIREEFMNGRWVLRDLEQSAGESGVGDLRREEWGCILS